MHALKSFYRRICGYGKSAFCGAREGFTLIETILAVTLVTMVFSGICGLILSTMQSSQNNLRRVQAMALAQEGLESLRYVRDSNWLQNYQWNGGGALWGQDLTLTAFAPEKTVWLQSISAPPFLLLSSDPTYATVSLGDFSFERSLQLRAIPDAGGLSIEEDQLEVTCTVTWRDHGRIQELELSTFLTNWQ